MQQYTSIQLLEQLKADTRNIISTTKGFLNLEAETLTRQPAPGKWSVAQAIEHLNTYGRYYLPAIRQALTQHQYQPEQQFKPGFLGDFFTKSMKPKADNEIKNKMKTMKNHNPSPELDAQKVLTEFLHQQEELLQLLDLAARNNISRIRIPITVAKFIRLKLGDTFRFLIAHHERHFVQCDNTLKALMPSGPVIASH